MQMLALWCGYGWGAGPWFLFFPLFWIAILVGVGLLFRRGRGHWHSNSGAAVLAERYARGEITEEEYRQRRTVLRDGPR
ncbi:MAG TPA: SHOCT domain-containing protein [Actinomycetota bacterium]